MSSADSLRCVKTGAEIFLQERNEWIRGDAHQAGDVYIFRVNPASRSYAVPSRVHFRLVMYSELGSDVLVALERHVVDYGYDGRVPVKMMER